MIRYRYDQLADALDIRIAVGDVARTEEIDSGTLVDLSASGDLLSIEVLRPSRRWPLEEILGHFDVDPADETMLRTLWGEPKSYPLAEQTAIGVKSDAGELVPS